MIDCFLQARFFFVKLSVGALITLLCVHSAGAASLSGNTTGDITLNDTNQVDVDDTYTIVSPDTLINGGSLSSSATLSNFGILTNSSFLFNQGTLNNDAVGTLINDSDLRNFNLLNNSGELNNFGILLNLDLAIGSTSQVGLNNNADGILNNYGTLNNNDGLTRTPLNNDGTLNNQTGGTLNNASDLTNNAGGVLNNDGELNNNGTMTNNAGGTLNNRMGGTLNNDDFGTLNNAGTLTNNTRGTLNNNAGGILNNGGVLVNNGGLNNAGTLNNDGTLVGGLGNTGTLNNRTGGTLNNDGELFNSTGMLNNDGILTNTGSLANLGGIQDRFTNNGTLINAGSLQGSFTNNGTLNNIGSVSNTNVVGTGAYVQTAGRTTIGGSVIQSSVSILGGMLQGRGTIVSNVLVNGADVNNLAVVTPGTSVFGFQTIGTLTIDGDYTQGEFSLLDIKFDETSIDLLDISGTANIDGALNFDFLGSDVEEGIYTFLMFSSLVGSFGATVLPQLTGFDLDVVFGANFANLVVTANAVPVPAAVWLFGSALIGLLGFRKTYISSSLKDLPK